MPESEQLRQLQLDWLNQSSLDATKRRLLTMKNRKVSHSIVVNSATAPSIEVDTEAAAVYVGFKRAKVARTIPLEVPGMHIAVDLDRNGEVVGVEALGVREAQVGRILKLAAIKAPNIDFAQARYLPAKLVPA